jgi:predicted DNA-binding transcriptional regulator AlpA
MVEVMATLSTARLAGNTIRLHTEGGGTTQSAAVLGPTMTVPQVATVWHCSEWTIYEMVRKGTCPVEPLRLGRLLRFPTESVLASVGLHYDPRTGHASIDLQDRIVP